jgi:hypothetical protein
MFRIRTSILSAALAVLALPGLAIASHHPAHDEAACEGTTVDPQHEVCGQIGVTLAEGASIDDVITESAPEATVIQASPPSYLLDVPVGDEGAYLEELRASEQVESASFVQLGFMSEPTAAATPAASAAPAPVAAIPDTAATAPPGMLSHLAVTLMCAAVLLLASWRAAYRSVRTR